MIIDMDLKKDSSFVKVREVFDNGEKQIKTIIKEEFIQKYTSLSRENKNNNDFMFFPPGNVEYFKSTNNHTYIIHTYNYKYFYEIEDNKDYLVVMNMSLDNTTLLSYKVYLTTGAFNKHISSFRLIVDNADAIDVKDEVAAVKYCINTIDEKKKNKISLKVKYKNIVD